MLFSFILFAYLLFTVFRLIRFFMNSYIILICVDYIPSFTRKVHYILLWGDCIFFVIKLFSTYFKTVILQTLLVIVHPTQLSHCPFNPVHCYLHFSQFLSCLLILMLICTSKRDC